MTVFAFPAAGRAPSIIAPAMSAMSGLRRRIVLNTGSEPLRFTGILFNSSYWPIFGQSMDGAEPAASRQQASQSRCADDGETAQGQTADRLTNRPAKPSPDERNRPNRWLFTVEAARALPQILCRCIGIDGHHGQRLHAVGECRRRRGPGLESLEDSSRPGRTQACVRID